MVMLWCVLGVQTLVGIPILERRYRRKAQGSVPVLFVVCGL